MTRSNKRRFRICLAAIAYVRRDLYIYSLVASSEDVRNTHNFQECMRLAIDIVKWDQTARRIVDNA